MSKTDNSGKLNLADLSRWDIFVKHYLDPRAYDWVLAIMRDLDKVGSCVAVSAANGSGKSSSVIGNAVVCHLLQYPNGRVVCTSAVERQLTHVIMGYLSRFRHLFPANAVFNKLDISVPLMDKNTGKQVGASEFISFTTNNAGKAESWHGDDERPLMIIIDEGKSVEDEIYSAFDRCTAQRRLVVSSPPVEASGEFYNIFHGRGSWPWKLHRVNYHQCPHIEKQTPGKYELMKKKYGEDHPIFRSMILGEFSQDSSLSVFNAKYVDNAMFSPPNWNEDRKRMFAIDWSAGSDEQVGGKMEGNRITFPVLAHEHDTGKIVTTMANWLKKEGVKEGEVIADDGGLGRPMNYDLEKQLGFRIARFNGGLPSTQPTYYPNRINQIWFETNDELRKGHIILPKDDILRHQLISRRKAPPSDNESRHKMESKRQMADRGVSSPDRADVVCMLVGSMLPIRVPKDRIPVVEVKNEIERSFFAECEWNEKKKLDIIGKSDIRDEKGALFPQIGIY